MNTSATESTQQLFSEFEAAEFWRTKFQVEPVFGSAVQELSMDWQEVFDVLPAAHADGAIRYINEGTNVLGEDPASILASLEEYASPICPASFEAHFRQGEYSYAIQGFESYSPDVQAVAESLRCATGCPVSVTAFLSPEASRATRIHYDKNDVFAYQVHGEKHWATFCPVDPLPNLRTPNVAIEEANLVRHCAYRLRQGHLLYLPRGWIHRVENQARDPSMHLSFVVFANAWVGVFANLMDAAYAALRARPAWRQSVSPTVTRFDAVDMIESMVNELKDSMLELMDGRPERYADFCRNDNVQHQCVAQGRESIAQANDQQDYVIEPTGAQYLLRHHEGDHSVRVSTDGTTFLPVRRTTLEAVERGGLQVSAFEQMTAGEGQAAAIESLDVLISRLGAFRLSGHCNAGN